MKFSFHPEAEAEFQAAIDYYEECEPGLGCDFALEVHSTIQGIIALPSSWPAIGGDIRRCLTRRFPFGVLYVVEAEEILILSVMHLHREPDYWKPRR
jgi:hypothetical protein